MDDDSDGKLNEDQLVALFSNLGCQLSAAEAIAIITDLEGDSSVSITFSAFMSAICQVMSLSPIDLFWISMLFKRLLIA